MTQPTSEFQEYAWLSVQVDQYYAAVRIFAQHHGRLCESYQTLPTREEWPQEQLMLLPEQPRQFFVTAASTLNYMGTTGIFEKTTFPQLSALSRDMMAFAFSTCFCFQWSVFEEFVKKSLFALVRDNLVAPDIASELRKLERRTEGLLRYLDSGKCFGRSPFTTVLPLPGWVPQTETCTYGDLDKIRILRNQLTHAAAGSSTPNGEPESEKLYTRSMWILRKFAENIDHECRQLRPAAGV